MPSEDTVNISQIGEFNFSVNKLVRFFISPEVLTRMTNEELRMVTEVVTGELTLREMNDADRND